MIELNKTAWLKEVLSCMSVCNKQHRNVRVWRHNCMHAQCENKILLYWECLWPFHCFNCYEVSWSSFIRETLLNGPSTGTHCLTTPLCGMWPLTCRQTRSHYWYANDVWLWPCGSHQILMILSRLTLKISRINAT